jgi:hypothetical protein
MSATLKLGTDGNWAAKKGSVLSYNDENGNFKPLPFTFDRSTSATRVNKQGLIEVVSNNEPRIDFLNDSKGALLLEPSRSNYVLYSETEGIVKGSNGWGGDADTIVTQNYGTAPYNGNKLKSTRVQFGGSNKQLRNVFSALTMIPTCSIWIKGISGETIKFGSNSNEGVFTLNGDWQYITQTGSSISTDRLVINTYSGTTARDIEIYAPQLEQGSYATSYIPTQGSIGTRVDDAAPNKLDLTPLNIGNSYTLFLDVDLTNIDSNKIFSSINNSSNSLSFTLRNFLGGIRVFNNLDASYPINTTIVSSNNKFVIKVDGNSYKIFGKGSSLSGTLTTQRDLGFINFYGDNTELKIKNFTIDNTDLSDAECETLVN